MPKKIPLTQGHFATVDDDDFEWLSQWKWMHHYHGYAVRVIRNKETKKVTLVTMHRLIMSAPNGMEVDHIDGDGLNNQRHNLRLATHQQNMANHKVRRDNSSGFTGVSWDKKRKQWKAYISIDGKHLYIGRFSSKEDAARAYNDAARVQYGEFHRNNL